MQRVQALRRDVSFQLVPREREEWRHFSINRPMELKKKEGRLTPALGKVRRLTSARKYPLAINSSRLH